MKLFGVAIALSTALASSGCGELARQGRSPVQLVVESLVGVPGGEADGREGTPLFSDIRTNGTYYNDLGRVSLRLILKDQGIPGIAATPSPLNAVTITRYRVDYVRADGRNTEGVDVPFGFMSEMTFTVPPDGLAEFSFDIVRNSAKREAPLQALMTNGLVINTVARVTFFGHDQAGNEVSANASLQINFAEFVDDEE